MFRKRSSLSIALIAFIFTSVFSFAARSQGGSEWVIPLRTPAVSSFWTQQLAFPFIPDSSMTTGSLCTPEHPDFERYRYEERIAYCGRNVSSATKASIYRRYGVSRRCKSQYTIDHFIPLSLGGTNDVNNLWPEPKSVKNLRHDLEYELFQRLSAGKISQAEAVRTIVHAKFNPPVDNPADFTFCR